MKMTFQIHLKEFIVQSVVECIDQLFQNYFPVCKKSLLARRGRFSGDRKSQLRTFLVENSIEHFNFHATIKCTKKFNQTFHVNTLSTSKCTKKLTKKLTKKCTKKCTKNVCLLLWLSFIYLKIKPKNNSVTLKLRS